MNKYSQIIREIAEDSYDIGPSYHYDQDKLNEAALELWNSLSTIKKQKIMIDQDFIDIFDSLLITQDLDTFNECIYEWFEETIFNDIKLEHNSIQYELNEKPYEDLNDWEFIKYKSQALMIGI